MSDVPGMDYRDLSHSECEDLLRKHKVGRLAYMLRNHVEIVPIHFVYDDGWIYIRSALGQKVRALHTAPWVAFEVDEVVSLSEWSSVVVHGSAQVLDPDGPESEVEALRRAIAALRSATPDALRPGDPAPERTFVLRISTDRMTGRTGIPAG